MASYPLLAMHDNRSELLLARCVGFGQLLRNLQHRGLANHAVCRLSGAIHQILALTTPRGTDLVRCDRNGAIPTVNIAV